MEVVPITEYKELLRLEDVWNSVLEKSDSDYPFLSFEWITSCWEYYCSDSQLLVILVKKKGDIIGIAPFMIKKMQFRGLPVKVVTFISSNHTNRASIIMTKDKYEITCGIFKYLKDSAPKYDAIYLDFIVKDSECDENIKKVLKEDWIRHIELSGYLSPYISINGNWNDYFSTRSKKFRRKLKNLQKKCTNENNYCIKNYTDNEIDSAISDIVKISKKTWKYGNSTAIANDSRDIRFFHSFAEKAAIKKWLSINILSYTGTPIAFDYKLLYKGRTYNLKVGFDKDFNNMSPGVCLFQHSIKDSFENNGYEYDFIGQNDPYKLCWTGLCREHKKYWIFSDSIYGKTLYFLENTLFQRMKRSPFIKRLVQEIRSDKINDVRRRKNEKLEKIKATG
jgi:CelD/BcsL family acetyltransferase involved in cellulose biosynthesis